MLVAAAVCPHPPLLIPAACGAAGWPAPDQARSPAQDADGVLRQVRAASAAAVADLLQAGPDLLVVVGGGDVTAAYGGSAAGSLAAYGIGFRTGSGPPVLPLSLTVGAWLVAEALLAAAPDHPAPDHPAPDHPAPDHPAPDHPGQSDARGLVLRLQSVAAGTPAAACARLGADLAAAAPRVALLAMGDACARKAAGVPGGADPVADDYDARVAAALATADLAGLARLDPALDAELSVAGRAAWQVLAGAAEGCQVHGSLRCSAAPYDVRYLVAYWEHVPGA